MSGQVTRFDMDNSFRLGMWQKPTQEERNRSTAEKFIRWKLGRFWKYVCADHAEHAYIFLKSQKGIFYNNEIH